MDDITYRWADAEQSTIAASDGRYIPAVVGNADYDALIEAGAPILPYEAA